MAFNLFDFSNLWGVSSIVNKPETAPQIRGATGGGMKPPTTSWIVLPNKTIQTKPSIMSLIIPKANAASSIDSSVLKQLQYDITNGATEEEVASSYPEFGGNAQLIKELHYDLKNWAKEDEVKNAYPELFGAPTTTPKVEPTKPEEQGFLSKTFEGIKSAPEAAFEWLTWLLTWGVKNLIGEDKFKKEGEMGNLWEVIGKQESALTNTLKTTKGLTGSAFTVAAPWISTALAWVGATDIWWKVLWAVGDAIHFAWQTALNQIPALKEMTTEQKNDFTDSLVNAFWVKSATTWVWGKAGIVKKLEKNPWTTLKNFGSSLINAFYETEKGTARAMQKYNAGLSPTRPITIGDVAGKYKIAGGTKQMGADAIVAKTKLWEKEIAPKIENTRSVISGETLMSKVFDDINQIVEPTQKAAMLKAFKQINEQYKWKQFSAKELADLKSTLQAKTLNVSETSAARSQILEMLSKEGRKTLIENVKKDTGKDITNSMFEYGALRTLEEMGQKAAEGAENLRITWRAGANGATLGIVDALTSVLTPVKNVVGWYLYRLGNGIEFIWPKWINTITDILRNSDKVKIQNPQVLMNILEQKTTAPIKAPAKPTPAAPWTLYKPPVPKAKVAPPAPKWPIVNVKEYIKGTAPELPKATIPKKPALFGKWKAPVDKPRAK